MIFYKETWGQFHILSLDFQLYIFSYLVWVCTSLVEWENPKTQVFHVSFCFGRHVYLYGRELLQLYTNQFFPREVQVVQDQKKNKMENINTIRGSWIKKKKKEGKKKNTEEAGWLRLEWAGDARTSWTVRWTTRRAHRAVRSTDMWPHAAGPAVTIWLFAGSWVGFGPALPLAQLTQPNQHPIPGLPFSIILCPACAWWFIEYK